jgi:hypothetical protein
VPSIAKRRGTPQGPLVLATAPNEPAPAQPPAPPISAPATPWPTAATAPQRLALAEPRPAPDWQRSLPAAILTAPAQPEAIRPTPQLLPQPPATPLPETTASPVRRPRAAEAADAPAPAETAPIPASGPFLPPTAEPRSPAADLRAPAPPLPATSAHDAGPEPAILVTSARLGPVQVDLTGSSSDLAVNLAANAQAAPLLDAAAPRLQQDLAAAGITLASLSVNGQRTDLSGGQKQKRPPPQLAAIAATRRPPPPATTPATDRFA